MTEVNIEGLNAVEKELRERPIQPLLRRHEALALAEAVKPAHSSTDALLAERRKVHGEFFDHAYITQCLKDVMQASKKWDALPHIHKEALDMIAHKIGRILAGDADHVDHWADIQGYARLVEQRLK